jgi:hypothetical protein
MILKYQSVDIKYLHPKGISICRGLYFSSIDYELKCSKKSNYDFTFELFSILKTNQVDNKNSIA